jgi:magnesium-transporting ATPase (P-type)
MAADCGAATVLAMPAPPALVAIPELDPEEDAGRLLADAGWSPGDATGSGTPLHHSYLMATTMSFAGITACQVGTAFASRTSRASLREIGFFTNPLLLGGIAFELVFAAALIYLPPLQSVFHTAALGLPELALLASFPVIVWGSDELRRAWRRRHEPTPTGAS